jgi:hypothetical protein
MMRVTLYAVVIVGVLVVHAAVDLGASNNLQSGTRTGTIGVGASSFSPSARDPESPYINRGSVLEILCSDVAQYFSTSLSLPVGAELESLALLYETSHPEATVGAELGATDLLLLDRSLSRSGGWLTRVVTAGEGHVPVGEVTRLAKDVRDAHQVQPGATYYLQVNSYCEGEWAKGASVTLYGALISYRYPAALPLSVK